MAAPNEPPPPYTENAPGAPPRHTNDIPLPDSPITTHNPEPIPPGQQSWYHQQRQQRQQRQQAPPEPRPPKQSSSAAQYFGSRPHRSVRTIPLTLKPNSIRADFDYPRSWAPDHDVSLQDWTTFVGFLIPDGAPVSDDKRLSPERRQAVEEVLREWNDRLFIPKGLRMVVDDGTGQPGPVPERYGSSASSANTSNWSRPESTGSRPTSTSSHMPPYSHGTSSYPHQQPQSASEPFSSTTQGYNQAHTNSTAPYRQPSVSSSNHMPPGSSRERWAQKLKNVAQEKDITYSKEGIRMSDKFSLSLGGLKVGKFNLDERGMNYGGKPIGPTLPVAQYHQGPPPQAQGGYPGHGPSGGFSAAPGPGAPAPHGAHGAHGAYGGYGPPGAHHPGAQSMGGPPQGQFAPPAGPPPPGHHAQQQTGTM